MYQPLCLAPERSGRGEEFALNFVNMNDASRELKGNLISRLWTFNLSGNLLRGCTCTHSVLGNY